MTNIYRNSYPLSLALFGSKGSNSNFQNLNKMQLYIIYYVSCCLPRYQWEMWAKLHLMWTSKLMKMIALGNDGNFCIVDRTRLIWILIITNYTWCATICEICLLMDHDPCIIIWVMFLEMITYMIFTNSQVIQ